MISYAPEAQFANISRITLCEREIQIAEKVKLFRPTLKGVLIVSSRGGFTKVIGGILNENFDDLVTGVEAGLVNKPRKKIENLVWKAGFNQELVANVVEFLEDLSRGGKLEEKETNENEASSRIKPVNNLTLEMWCDKTFSAGCGWLGWKPKEVLETTLGALQLAIDGKIDFVKKTNPFGSDETKEETMAENLVNQPPNPSLAAEQIMASLNRRIRDQRRQRIKKG